MCIVLFLLSCPINHFTTPQINLIILCWSLTPNVGWEPQH